MKGLFRYRGFRWFVLPATLLFLLLALGLTVTWYVMRANGATRRDALVAQLDATDPNWRSTDLTAARNAALPPDDRNAAVQALAATKLTAKTFDEWRNEDRWRGELKPPHLPHADDLREARRVLGDSRAAVARARAVRHLPSGGFPLTFKEPDTIGTLLTNTQELRKAASLLDLAALLAAFDRSGDDALDSCHAILATGRGLGDEPTIISMLVRIAVTSIAVKATERTLGWAAASEAMLAELQAAFAAEAKAPRLVYALRGERAVMYRLMENYDHGQITLSQLSGGSGPTFFERVLNVPVRATLPEQQAMLLELLNKGIAAAERPPHERDAEFDEIELRAMKLRRTDRFRYILVGLLVPAVSKMNEAENRVTAWLHSATVGLACERFRLKTGHYPNALADLPKDLLAEIPTDPYTGRAVLFKRTDDGVVVYCTGWDLKDDGGTNLDPKSEKGWDIGFRLFDPARRRQSPLPKGEPIEAGYGFGTSVRVQPGGEPVTTPNTPPPVSPRKP